MINTEKRNIRFLSITGTDVSKEDRLIEDHDQLLDVINFFRKEEKKIVYTMGAYDMFHIGHARYLQKAKECGDILVVGLDSDPYIKETKGSERPVVPYDERWETLAHNRSVNIVTILETQSANMELVKRIHPDVVVLSFSSAKEDLEEYEKKMKAKYGPHCVEVKIFERQAETSTSARLRLVIINGSKKLLEIMQECSEKLKNAWDEFINSNGGEK